ncbi:MAG TPA: rRNA maturation RNase YbeY [Fimbriimonas sp.]|nr:rRNA maturation RNase YbeY [Fimbriimonas sp.]
MIDISSNTTVAFAVDTVVVALEAAAVELQVKQLVGVLFCDTEEMLALNLRFRGVNESTDVLTFPSGSKEPLPLGDIAICVPFAKDQAELRGVTLENELIALGVHGLLHLYGYDDIEDDDRAAMQKAMNDVGQKIGVQIDGAWTSILH